MKIRSVSLSRILPLCLSPAAVALGFVLMKSAPLGVVAPPSQPVAMPDHTPWTAVRAARMPTGSLR